MEYSFVLLWLARYLDEPQFRFTSCLSFSFLSEKKALKKTASRLVRCPREKKQLMCEYIRPAPVRVRAGFGGRASLHRVEVSNSSEARIKRAKQKATCMYTDGWMGVDADRGFCFLSFRRHHRHPKKKNEMQELSRKMKEVLIHRAGGSLLAGATVLDRDTRERLLDVHASASLGGRERERGGE